jgi:hypothetical protein
LTAGILLVSMGMATTQVGAADNLLTNPGAEEGLGGWRKFSETMPAPQQPDGGMSFALNEPSTVLSEEYFPAPDGATFEVAAKVTFEAPEQGGVVYVGLAPYDGDKTPIKAAEVHVVEDTVTELAQDAARGQTLLRLQDGAAWGAAFERDSLLERNGVVAFDVSAEGLGDLPNRNLSARGLKVISRDGGWEVELAKPLERDWPAGTKVRLHYDSATYCYVGSAPASSDWKDIMGSLSTSVPGKAPSKGHLWPGTRFVRFVVLSTRDGNDHPGRVFFDDLSLTSVP